MQPFARTLLLALGFATLATSFALAADFVVDLEPGDDFVVQDGRVSGEQLLANNIDGAPRSSAALLMGRGSPEIHTLCLYREDSPDNRDATWLWKGGGGAVTNLSLKVDGLVSVDADPLTNECSFNSGGDPVYDDPDKLVGSIPAMIQIGADVEQPLLLRANGLGVHWLLARGTTPKFILGIDHGRDWVWKVEADGTQCWGDAGPTFGSTQDGDQGIQSFDVCLDRVENGADEFVRFTLDIDDDGAGSRQIDLVRPVIQGTGVTSHGGSMWGDVNVASFDSGDEVCGSVPGAGLSCRTTIDPTDGSEHACAGTMPETSASGLFYALCY